jgi:hypothetical protein
MLPAKKRSFSMKKKSLLIVLALAVLAVGGLSAQGIALSAGAYGDFFVMGKTTDNDGTKDTTTTAGGGFGLFFDATYAEIGLGLDFGKNTDNGVDSEMTFMTISLLGKYPIVLNDTVTLFPLLGFDWKIFLAGKRGPLEIERADVKDMGGEETDADAFSIDVGVGADFTLTEKLYIRADALLGFKLPSKSESEAISDSDGKLKIITLGPTVKVGLGYRF